MSDKQHCFTIAEFMAHYRISKATIYREIAAGELSSIKIARRRIITPEAAAQWEARKAAAELSC